MTVKLNFSKTAPAKLDALVVFIGTDRKLGATAAQLDQNTGGLLGYHLKIQSKFTGKKDQILTLSAPAKGVAASKIILVGNGGEDPATYTAAGGKLFAALQGGGARTAAILADSYLPEKARVGTKGKPPVAPPSVAIVAAHLALGLTLRSYRFENYKSKPAEDDGGLQTVTIVTNDATGAKAAYADLDAVAQGVFLARDLGNEPANVLYPESFANRVRDELRPLGVQVEIFDEKRLAKLGFGAHLAVGMGSARPPRLVIMRWPGTKGKKADKPLALVGKGVTFDTGGYSIKPAGGMEDMKYDMCGAAAVVGTMKTLALRGSNASVVGVIGLAENMVSSNAMRPGDVFTTLSGKTVEVLNTDAEGRLVLCDALTYVQRTFDPRAIIDLATLTGAIVVALGSEYTGAFTNNDDLWDQLNATGKATGDKLWRMPLDEAYRKAMDGTVSDLRNISGGRDGGACTAAGYLERFIDDGRPWAHLDIAGTAWTKADKPTAPKPIPGYGVQLLDRLIADHYE